MRAIISSVLLLTILTDGLLAVDVATKIRKKNVILLSRGKRYVQWPKGSNFVVSYQKKNKIKIYTNFKIVD